MIKIICLSFLLVSCGPLFKNHSTERAEAMLRAEAFCFCKGGVRVLKQTKYRTISDTFDVTCEDGTRDYSVENYIIYNESCEE
jgi:hypothetical protein